ncbi:MAG: hypothetical protein WDM85_16825 [Caulobacteraceae bacterium]
MTAEEIAQIVSLCRVRAGPQGGRGQDLSDREPAGPGGAPRGLRLHRRAAGGDPASAARSH